jgi:hypothetical protein
MLVSPTIASRQFESSTPILKQLGQLRIPKAIRVVHTITRRYKNITGLKSRYENTPVLFFHEPCGTFQVRLPNVSAAVAVSLALLS